MNWKNTTERYGALSIGMHWVMLLLLIAVYACIELRVIYPKGTDPRDALKMWHFMLGLSVFTLVWIRLVLRLIQITPSVDQEPIVFQQLLAKAFHIGLYVLMIGMPISGWIILSGEAKPIPFFGFDLPPLIGENKVLAKSIEEIHETVGTIGYYLIGIHTTAALFHHYIQKDNTLSRMLPWKGSERTG